ncbi:hypothetical protein PIB30_087267 [Stylosanthes scabra]|uniref:DUF1639 family protein n=1 Tax=Stylosanthes scabra TaxID=79078 RepID=A0ABU6WT26_9FABA|nr:hypothetical protein [Stylosanthes scabra]
MVLPGDRGTIQPPESMATSPNRSNRLHNFNLPYLKWGSQKHLRCTNSAAGASGSSSGDRRSPVSMSDDSPPRRKRETEQERNHSVGSKMTRPRINGKSRSGAADGVKDGIEAMRQKLMFDLKTEADKMKDAILRNKEDDKMKVEEEEEKERESPPPSVTEGAKTWNLRTRRAEWKIPSSGGGSEKRLKIDEKSSPARTDGGAVKLLKLRSNSDKSAPRPKFSIQLSKKEIEEDFMKMVGHRPPRRPNKRPRSVRKQLDGLVPGLWLTEVTPDLYKVAEDAGNGKVRQSGKGKGKGKDKMLVSSDSDDEES